MLFSLCLTPGCTLIPRKELLHSSNNLIIVNDAQGTTLNCLALMTSRIYVYGYTKLYICTLKATIWYNFLNKSITS